MAGTLEHVGVLYCPVRAHEFWDRCPILLSITHLHLRIEFLQYQQQTINAFSQYLARVKQHRSLDTLEVVVSVSGTLGTLGAGSSSCSRAGCDALVAAARIHQIKQLAIHVELDRSQNILEVVNGLVTADHQMLCDGKPLALQKQRTTRSTNYAIDPGLAGPPGIRLLRLESLLSHDDCHPLNHRTRWAEVIEILAKHTELRTTLIIPAEFKWLEADAAARGHERRRRTERIRMVSSTRVLFVSC